MSNDASRAIQNWSYYIWPATALAFIIPLLITRSLLSKDPQQVGGTMPMQQRAVMWFCEPSERYGCSYLSPPGCWEDRIIGQLAEIRLDFRSKTYTRCIGHKHDILCDNYTMHVETESEYLDDRFTNIRIERYGGAFFQISNDENRFVEVISQSVAPVVTFGFCYPR